MSNLTIEELEKIRDDAHIAAAAAAYAVYTAANAAADAAWGVYITAYAAWDAAAYSAAAAADAYEAARNKKEGV
jgi:hypothetical protein